MSGSDEIHYRIGALAKNGHHLELVTGVEGRDGFVGQQGVAAHGQRTREQGAGEFAARQRGHRSLA